VNIEETPAIMRVSGLIKHPSTRLEKEG